MKTLYFEGAGSPSADRSKATIGNCRIRTAFHLDNGRPVYLEILCGQKPYKGNPEVYKWLYTGFVDYCFYITDDKPNDDGNYHRLLRHGGDKAQKKAEMVFRRRMSAEYRTPRESEKLRKQAYAYVEDFVEHHTVFEYSKAGILGFLKSIGATFDDIEVINDNYMVFKENFVGGCDSYNYGDERGF